VSLVCRGSLEPEPLSLQQLAREEINQALDGRSLQDLGLPTRLRSAQVPLVSSLISVKHKDSSKDERNILQHFAVSSTAFVGVIHYVCKIFCDVLHILSKLSFFL